MKMTRWLTVALGVLMIGAWAVTARAEFVNNGNGTVTDTSTGLMWQRDTARDGQGDYDTMTWEEALAYCEALDLGGETDWRLPTIKDLGSLVDLSRYDPAINTTSFPNTISSSYWSATTSADRTGYAWHVGFYYGNGYWFNKSNYHYVRAVRGGQSDLVMPWILLLLLQGD